MSFEEEFDKIIRQKAEELHYSFDPGNWEKASGMLDAERKSAVVKTTGRAGAVAVMITAVLGVSLAIFLYTGNNSATSVIAEVSQSGSGGAERIQPVLSGTEIEADGNNLMKEHFAAPAPRSKPVTGRQTPAFDAGGPTPDEMAPESLVETVHAANSLSEAPPVQTAISIPGNDQDELAASVPAEIHGIIHPEEASNAFSVPDDASAVSEGNLAIEPLSGIHAFLPYFSEQGTVDEQFSPLAFYDEDYFMKGKRNNFFVNMEAGVAYMPGWTNNGKVDAQGFNWFGGFNYGMYLSRNILLITGIQAYHISHISKPFYALEGREYHFGSNPTGTVVTSDQLLYAAIPLQLGLDAGRNSRITVGINAAYLLQASNTIQTYSVLDNVRTYGTEVKNKGVYEGLNPYNISLTGSYSQAMGQRLNIKAEALYGLSDIFRNNTFSSNAEKAIGIRLGLQYTLLNR